MWYKICNKTLKSLPSFEQVHKYYSLYSAVLGRVHPTPYPPSPPSPPQPYQAKTVEITGGHVPRVPPRGLVGGPSRSSCHKNTAWGRWTGEERLEPLHQGGVKVHVGRGQIEVD